MPVTSNDIANQALVMMGGNQPPVTGFAPTFDQSTAGKALARIYSPCVATVLRSYGWDATRRYVDLTLSGNPPPVGWAFEYLYPPFSLEQWQLIDPSNTDPNDPLPTTWVVYNTLVAAVQTKVLASDVQNAKMVLNNNPTESVWDPLLREQVVRALASELSMAIAGRPDTEQSMMQSSMLAGEINKSRQD